jgi:hypothetical protein
MDWRYTAGLAEGFLLGIMTVAGVAAIRVGWVLGRERRRVVRPRLWGQGMLVLAASLALVPLWLALFGPGTVSIALTVVACAGILAAAVMRQRACRDRRRGGSAPTPPTFPAS